MVCTLSYTSQWVTVSWRASRPDIADWVGLYEAGDDPSVVGMHGLVGD